MLKRGKSTSYGRVSNSRSGKEKTILSPSIQCQVAGVMSDTSIQTNRMCQSNNQDVIGRPQ